MLAKIKAWIKANPKIALIGVAVFVIILGFSVCKSNQKKKLDAKISFLEGQNSVLESQLEAQEKLHVEQFKEWDKKKAELQGMIDSSMTRISVLETTIGDSDTRRLELEKLLDGSEKDFEKQANVYHSLYVEAVNQVDALKLARIEDKKVISGLQQQLSLETAAKLAYKADWIAEKKLREEEQRKGSLKDVKIRRLERSGKTKNLGLLAFLAAGVVLAVTK